MLEELLPEGSLRDERLRVRAVVLLKALMNKPGGSFGAVFGKCAAKVKAAYRFCENETLSLLTLLVPTFRVVGRSIRDSGASTVLCIQDTTELDLTHLQAMEGLGEVGNPLCRGLFLHCGLAVSTRGVPQGLLSAQTWIRESGERGKAATRRERGFEDKESAKWWKAIEMAENAVGKAGLLVHVADRESDIYDVFARSQAVGYRLLVRSRIDRALADGSGTLRTAMDSWRVAGQRVVPVKARPARDGKPEREARDAVLSIRFGEISFSQPRGSGALTVTGILAREESPPDGEAGLEWLLLTTDRIERFADAAERIDWYVLRWLIEEFHKCLKSTCRVEERQFEEREHLEVALALLLLVSARLLQLRNLARSEPELPAEVAFLPDELEVLEAHFEDSGHRPRLVPKTMRTAIRMIAMLGGFLARKGDGEPGFETLARGYTQLTAMVDGYRLARRRLRRKTLRRPLLTDPIPPQGQ